MEVWKDWQLDLAGCEQDMSITEKDLQPQKPLWHEDTRGPRRNHPQNLVLTDAAARMVHFNMPVHFRATCRPDLVKKYMCSIMSILVMCLHGIST